MLLRDWIRSMHNGFKSASFFINGGIKGKVTFHPPGIRGWAVLADRI